jgi:alpha-glucosidase
MTRSEEWWKRSVFYEVYVRSFMDSDGDGIGDLRGLISKLDYLKSLGIDAVWLSPIYPSPLFDCGYDVACYTDIDPSYGTMEDFERLIQEAHKRGIRIIMDLVLNHTSDQHPWFQESKSSRLSAKRNWYIWRDGKDGGPPNNWKSVFGGSAWERDKCTDQYYYHMFLPQQPDLNWRNPEVKVAMFTMVRFWLDKGVDGFRLDAVDALFEDEMLTDDEERSSNLERHDDIKDIVDIAKIYMLFKHQINSPETHDILKELRKVVDEYPERVLIGEVYLSPAEAVKYYGSGEELHLVFNFNLLEIAKLDASLIRDAIRVWENQAIWPAYALSNHDRSRQFTSFGNDRSEEIAKVTAALTLTLKGTPFLYYGEEIGMEDLLLDNISQFKDNMAIRFYEACLFKMSPQEAVRWAAHLTRDRSRSPMQWNAAVNAGFSEAKPWLPVDQNCVLKNVSVQEADPKSLLSFYKRLIWTRKNCSALLYGSYISINNDASDYLAFLRKDEERTCLVVLNMSDKEKIVRFDLSAYEISSQSARLLLTSHKQHANRDDLERLLIAPYEVYIAEIGI